MASQSGGPCGTVPVTHLALLLSISSIYRRSKLASRNERPVGRQPTFVAGHRTPIRPITGRHSLLPTSQSRTAIGGPHGTLSQPKPGAMRGFHVPLEKYAGLGACYRPGGIRTTRTQSPGVAPASSTFWSSVSTTSACRSSRSLSQIQIPSPCQLSSTHPVCGYQEGAPLTICTPHITCFITLSGQLFIHAPRFTRWHGWFPTSIRGNNFSVRLRVAVVQRNSRQATQTGLCRLQPYYS